MRGSANALRGSTIKVDSEPSSLTIRESELAVASLWSHIRTVNKHNALGEYATPGQRAGLARSYWFHPGSLTARAHSGASSARVNMISETEIN